jgi:hypothetical protein
MMVLSVAVWGTVPTVANTAFRDALTMHWPINDFYIDSLLSTSYCSMIDIIATFLPTEAVIS